MTSLHYSLSNYAYKSKIFTGFSQLQKQEEFVDLTLAADGCLVKVHRNLIALASPYLREILKSLTSYSPVIFLNNVSQKILAYLLEYIYHGEVNIPGELVDAFIEVSKSLHIAGIEDLEPPKMKKNPPIREPPERRTNTATHETINSDNILEDQQYYSDTEYNGADYSMEDQHPSANFINDAEFTMQDPNSNFVIEHQIQESNRQSVQNISLIDIDENAAVETHKNIGNFLLYNTQSCIQSQQNQTNTYIPITTENKAQQPLPITLAADYKIIVKTNNTVQPAENSEMQNNIPVIEIQHVGLPQQDHNPTQDLNGTLPCLSTDFITHANQATPQINEPIIEIGDDVNINVENSLEMDVDKSQVPLGGNVTNVLPFDYKANLNDMKNMSQYSVSERGALQLILNRYLYCCHFSTRTKNRWRCIDYRRRACPAFVDTKDGAIVARKGIHGHKFHDDKIYKKHKRGLIYNTMEQTVAARNLKEKEGLRMVSIDEGDAE